MTCHGGSHHAKANKPDARFVHESTSRDSATIVS
jgi:hypothetical protein